MRRDAAGAGANPMSMTLGAASVNHSIAQHFLVEYAAADKSWPPIL